MNTKETPQEEKEAHHGSNVKRFREMQSMKQETLAEKLKLSQQQISKLESQEVIKDEMLDKLAKVLHVSVEAFKKCNDEIAVNIISNTFHEQSIAYQYNFNPIEKIMALYDEKTKLYERMLKATQDENMLLKNLLEGRR